ncbi:MAG: hypothetical protein ACI9CZ_001390, partial [Flavobacterium sp.]
TFKALKTRALKMKVFALPSRSLRTIPRKGRL